MKKIFSLLAAALLIAACTPKEEVGTPFQAGQKVTLAASMGGNGAKQMPGKQRVAGVDNGEQIDLTWNEGDQITVKVGDATAVFTLESGAGSASATFTGTMPASGTTYQVSYPVNYDESVLANQTYTANGFGKGLMKMSTKVDGTLDGGFKLIADNALLGLQLSGAQTLGKIVVTNTATAKTYTLNCAGVTLSNAATLFYIVVPVGEWASGFGVDVYDNTDTKVTSFAKATTATFVAGDAMVMPVKEVEAENNVTAGGFSVSADKQVSFSPGNLQYHPANNVWQFAANQTDYIGDANKYISSTYDGWLDLFGWSTSANNFGVSTSENNSDYSGSFVDWGTNKIGNDAPNTWRTLTRDEWEYLLENRNNASSLRGVAQVNGVNGLIFLPDTWTCPAGVTFKSGFHGSYGAEYYAAYQTFTADQWSKLEKSGAVFLPAAGGYRHGTYVNFVQNYGSYWSATGIYSDCAYYLSFYSGGANMDYRIRYSGHSVRLVKDVEGETTEPGEPDHGTPDTPEEPTPVVGVFSVTEGKTVTFSPGNLQYTQSTNTWSFASAQWEMLGTDNVTGGSVSSDQYGEDKSGTALADKVDLFGWSTSANNFGVSTSTSRSDYSGSFVDWGTNKIGNDAPNTWRTLTYDEWEYLRGDRPNASSLRGVAQVNGVNGLILLPDSWTCPAGVIFKSGFHSTYGVDYYAVYQTFTADQWSKLEKSGAIFLPAAGMRYGSDVSRVQGYGYYWSATEGDGDNARFLSFYYCGAGMGYNGHCYGQSVRLVKDL